jgi:hypothetical protein
MWACLALPWRDEKTDTNTEGAARLDYVDFPTASFRVAVRELESVTTYGSSSVAACVSGESCSQTDGRSV